MDDKECIKRIRTGNFKNEYGFDMNLLVGTVGHLMEMLDDGKIAEVIRCRKCKYWDHQVCNVRCIPLPQEDDNGFCDRAKLREI